MRVLCEEIDLPAPVPDVFAAFLSWPRPVFLDSSRVHPHLGRYSYLAAGPAVSLSSKNGRLAVHLDDGAWPALGRLRELLSSAERDASGDPFPVLQSILRAYPARRIAGLPPFQGGILGYFGYDLGQHLEVLPRRALDDVGLPDLHVGVYPWVLAHDHVAGRTWLIANALDGDVASARRVLREVRRAVVAARPHGAEPDPPKSQPSLAWNFTRDRYLEAIAAAKAYIAAGDIYEVCLSQRLTVELDEHPWPLYRRLRAVSPVPYGAYLGFPDATVVSGSPEMFLRLQGRQVETRPIKGTRPRGATPELNRQLIAELRSSEKECAENLMIVDLLRNDLGRVCRIGSVRVPELFAVESYSTVHQMVSTVQGTLRPELDGVDLLRACFPGGSVTGCPKIRAMEIIDELEPTQRGIYCGAIGFLAFDGDVDTSIVIRTVVVKGTRAYLQVGGAIVADSDPAAEYQETLDKAQAALLAIAGRRLGTELAAAR